jgi:hypothetical protein
MTNFIHNGSRGRLAIESHCDGLEAVGTGGPSNILLKPSVSWCTFAATADTYRAVEGNNLMVLLVRKMETVMVGLILTKSPGPLTLPQAPLWNESNQEDEKNKLH